VISRFAGVVSAFDVGRHSFSESEAGWVDEAGNVWDLQSGAVQCGASSLEPRATLRMYWFAWQGHHPETYLWQPEANDGAKTLSDPGKLPGFTIGMVAGILLLGALIIRRRQRS
jgi:hypothetical protein